MSAGTIRRAGLLMCSGGRVLVALLRTDHYEYAGRYLGAVGRGWIRFNITSNCQPTEEARPGQAGQIRVSEYEYERQISKMEAVHSMGLGGCNHYSRTRTSLYTLHMPASSYLYKYSCTRPPSRGRALCAQRPVQ